MAANMVHFDMLDPARNPRTTPFAAPRRDL